MFTMFNAPLTHVDISGSRDVTELNNDGMIKLGDVYYQTDSILSIFFDTYLINDNSSFCAHFFSNWLAMSRFSFWKVFVKCPFLSVNGIFDDVRYDVISM